MSQITRRSFLPAAALGAAGCSQPGTRTTDAPGAQRVHPLAGVPRQNLKITDVTVTLLSYELPEGRQWLTGRYVTWKTDGVLVRVFTDQGIMGIGEPSPYGGPVEIKAYIENYAKPALVGRNPFDVEQLTDVWAGARRPAVIAWAGIDCALWDIIGKAVNKPVYELLATDGSPETHLRVYASGGVEYAWYDRPEALIEEAVRHKEAGYTAFKFRIGTDWKAAGMTIAKYVPYLEKMRAAVGADFELMQEANMRWTLEECLELCPVLESLKFHWFEEPIPVNNESSVEDHLKIVAALPAVPVSGGESRPTRESFKEWIDRDAYDIVQPDCNTTGVTRAWHIARYAHLKGKPCCPHNWHGGLTTMANAALVAGIPNRDMLELNQTENPLKEDIFKDPLVVRKGYMDLPARPGFGVEVIDEPEKKFPYIPGPYNRPNPKIPG